MNTTPPHSSTSAAAGSAPSSSALPAGISTAQVDALLRSVMARVRTEDVFGELQIKNASLVCAAKESGASAEYRMFFEGGKLWVSLVTGDRWLSQSIEADLVHTGDKIEELIEEELANLEWDLPRLSYEHFRDEKKLYTFRSCLNGPVGVMELFTDKGEKWAAIALLAYESTFRPLGDMQAGDDED